MTDETNHAVDCAEIRQYTGTTLIQRARFTITPTTVTRRRKTVSAYRVVIESDVLEEGGTTKRYRDEAVFAEGDQHSSEAQTVFDAETALEAVHEWLFGEITNSFAGAALFDAYRTATLWYEALPALHDFGAIMAATPARRWATEFVDAIRDIVADTRGFEGIQPVVIYRDVPQPVEIAKSVTGQLIQRLRFTVGQEVLGSWTAKVIIHRDEADSDVIRQETFGTGDEAEGWVWRLATDHFMDFSEEELGGADIRWQLSAYDDPTEAHLALARFIISHVSEYLEEEVNEQALERKRAFGQPITWGIQDYESGQFTLRYTEYPGTDGASTKFVDAGGNVWYEDDEGNPVDEHGNRLDVGEETGE